MAGIATAETAPKTASPKDATGVSPDVESIMTDIRKAVRDRAEEGTKSEREFKADVRQRMLQPLGSRGFTDDFSERVRSRDPVRWNIHLGARNLREARSAPLRALRWLCSPLTRALVNLDAAAGAAARQAEINEYHRRLLWALNRDLELTRLELGIVKRELRRLGIHADVSFASGGDGPARGRGESRSGRSGRGRGDRRRGNGASSEREGGGRRDRRGPRPQRGGRGERGGGSRDE